MPEFPSPIVSSLEASVHPYPYVFVAEDGTIRELTPDERELLQTPAIPPSGPYAQLKSRYDERTATGDFAGFCLRSAIPSQIRHEVLIGDLSVQGMKKSLKPNLISLSASRAAMTSLR